MEFLSPCTELKYTGIQISAATIELLMVPSETGIFVLKQIKHISYKTLLSIGTIDNRLKGL